MSESPQSLELRLLGPAAAARDIPKGKPLVLLATLAAHAGEVVGTERLADYVWPDQPPANQRATLQTYVMRLRRALGDTAIVTVGAGYLLGIPAEHTDIGLFQRLRDRAGQRRAAGDVDGERELLGAAMDLWRGQPFAGIDAPRLRAEVGEGLLEDWATAFERSVHIDLARGDTGELVRRLRTVLVHFPLRESMWVLLLRALRDANRRAEALSEYHRVRAVLDAELGVLPGPELGAAYQELLAETALDTLPADTVPAVPRVRQLPRRLPDFVGRQDELRTVVDMITSDAANVVVIWGLAGIGKSALAFSAAHEVRERYPDGQWYVTLGGGTPNPMPVDDAVAELLMSGGIDAAAVPPSRAARVALFRSLTAGRRVLLMLDNVWDTAQVMPLVPGTSDSLVLITSRSTLPALAGARRMRLTPLTEDDSVRVLAELLGHARVSAEPDEARELARLCGGLPLALRLLGTRFQHMPEVSVAAMVRRLRHEHDRLDELTEGGRGVRAGLAVSLTGLRADVRTAFARMALLPRSFPAFALGALVDGSDGARLVEVLVAAGLLDCVGVGETGVLSYQPHDLVGLYAAERLGDEPPLSLRAGQRRLLDAVLSRCVELYEYPDIAGGWLPAEITCRGDGSADVVTWLQVHGDLLLGVIAAGCHYGWCDEVAVLAELVLPTMADCGRGPSVVVAAERLRAAALDRGQHRVAWRATYLLGIAVLQNDPARAADLFDQCVTAFGALHCEFERLHALVELAYTLSLQDKPAQPIADEAVRAATATGDDHVLSFVLRCCADILQHQDRPAEAEPTYRRATEAAERNGHPQLRQVAYRRLAGCLLDLGDADGAAVALAAARRIITTPWSRWPDAWNQYIEARLKLATGDPQAALRHARRAARAAIDSGSTRGRTIMVALLAAAYRAAGKPAVAEKLQGRLLPPGMTAN